MRATSILALARIFAAASLGTSPASASVSVAASSTSSHFAYLLASLQIEPICSRVYLGINFYLLLLACASGAARKSTVMIRYFKPARDFRRLRHQGVATSCLAVFK